MNRKDFIRTGAAGLAAMATSCRPPGWNEQKANSPQSFSAENHSTIEWTMVTTWPPNFPVLHEGCQLFADRVFQMSAGRLKINVYGGGELVPPLEAFDNVSSGTVEMANGAGYYWAGKMKAAQFFASVPFGMNAQQMNAWITRGGGQELWNALYEPYGVIPFPSGNTGVQMGGWFNKEINTVQDLQGLKIRMPGLGGKVISAAGATAMNISGQELYTSLERGIIDATEWIGPYHDYLMGFHKIAKYYYYPGWHEPGTVLETIINKSAYERLPADLQAILTTAIYWQNVYTISEFETMNSVYMDKILESNAELRQFPAEVIEVLRSMTHEVVQELIESDAECRKIYDSFSSFRDRISSWSQYSEHIYQSTLMKGQELPINDL